MESRRVLFRIGVTYQTTRPQLERIPVILRDAVLAQSPAHFDRAHFAAFGDSAYEFECVYYVDSPDYNVYMDIQQRINLAIVQAFETEGIEFAYPTRTLFVQRSGDNAPEE
jgi:small-conductance mechanosensitive channel